MILRENEHRPDLLATLVEVYFIYHFFFLFSPLSVGGYPLEDGDFEEKKMGRVG